MKRHSLLLTLAMIVTGCPKRQTVTRLVYVPTPAPTSAAPQQQTPTETMTIEEPAPPPTEEEVDLPPPPEPVSPKPTNKGRRRTTRAENPSAADDTAESDTQPQAPAAEVPALEPRASSQQQATMRNDITQLQSATKDKINQLAQKKMNPQDSKVLEDARKFLEESQHALNDGELQRSSNLVHKASLLVSALAQNY